MSAKATRSDCGSHFYRMLTVTDTEHQTSEKAQKPTAKTRQCWSNMNEDYGGDRKVDKQTDGQTDFHDCMCESCYVYISAKKTIQNSMLIHHCDFHALTLLQKRHKLLILLSDPK